MAEKKVLRQGELVKSTGFRFESEHNISEVFTEFGKNHRRLRVFHDQGLKCSNPACRNEGSRLICTVDKSGGIHWDVYTESLILMNVDHIIAKINGGTNYIKNLQPMCQPCNYLKGDKNVTNEELAILYHENLKTRKRKLRAS